MPSIGYSRSAFCRWRERDCLFRLAADCARDRYTENVVGGAREGESYSRRLLEMAKDDESLPPPLRARCALAIRPPNTVPLLRSPLTGVHKRLDTLGILDTLDTTSASDEGCALAPDATQIDYEFGVWPGTHFPGEIAFPETQRLLSN